MSKDDVRAFYFGAINRLLDQFEVPKAGRQDYILQIHESLKQDQGIESTKQMTPKEFHDYVEKCYIELQTEYGLDSDLDDELKFE